MSSPVLRGGSVLKRSSRPFVAALLAGLASFVGGSNTPMAAAPQHHDQVPGFYRLKVGDLEVTDVFLAPSIPAITIDWPPGEKQRPWPPISSTLISGERDAVLVDTPITVEQARALANGVGAGGKNLT